MNSTQKFIEEHQYQVTANTAMVIPVSALEGKVIVDAKEIKGLLESISDGGFNQVNVIGMARKLLNSTEGLSDE